MLNEDNIIDIWTGLKEFFDKNVEKKTQVKKL
jgi:hypothetical protein